MIFAGQQQFIDSVFGIVASGDISKIMKLEASGISTGTTRTLTVPNANGIIALTDQVDGSILHTNLAGMPSGSNADQIGRG